MKKLLIAGVVLGLSFTAAYLLAATLFITQEQALASSILSELKFESQPTGTGLIGAPPRFRVSAQTIEHLQKLQKDGTLLEVHNNGTVVPVAAQR